MNVPVIYKHTQHSDLPFSTILHSKEVGLFTEIGDSRAGAEKVQDKHGAFQWAGKKRSAQIIKRTWKPAYRFWLASSEESEASK